MTEDTKFTIGLFFVVYFVMTFFIWVIRATDRDCERRYLDYAFPITKLHCKVGQ